MKQETGHKCHAEGCDVLVAPKFLMCWPHWKMVPGNIRKALWKEYRQGQEVDKRPTQEYLLVATAAVVAVALKEGRTVVAHQAVESAPSPGM